MAKRQDHKPVIRRMLSEGAKPVDIARDLKLSIGYVRQVANENKPKGK